LTFSKRTSTSNGPLRIVEKMSGRVELDEGQHQRAYLLGVMTVVAFAPKPDSRTAANSRLIRSFRRRRLMLLREISSPGEFFQAFGIGNFHNSSPDRNDAFVFPVAEQLVDILSRRVDEFAKFSLRHRDIAK